MRTAPLTANVTHTIEYDRPRVGWEIDISLEISALPGEPQTHDYPGSDAEPEIVNWGVSEITRCTQYACETVSSVDHPEIWAMARAIVSAEIGVLSADPAELFELIPDGEPDPSEEY